ncbi:MAG TPA: flavodoxin family protein [Opitutales bacterium]|nr:flavodoxin family protein [Opitutales bacterium]
MNVTLIDASPRQGGTVSRLADAFAEGATLSGHSARVVRLAELSIRPCASCGRCIETGRCAVRDDIAQVEEALEQADFIVFASPTHYANLSALLLNTFERLVGFLVDKRPFPPVSRTLRGKKAAAIVTCAAPWPFNWMLGHSSGCVSQIRKVCLQSGVKLETVLVAPGTGRPGFKMDQFLARARRAGATV